MSPEQVRGEIAGVPSDIFSLGCILYEMLGGRRPFARETVHATVAATLKDEPRPLARVESPAPLDRLVRQCLQKDPGHRFASAQLLATELRSIVHRASKAPWSRWLFVAGWLGTLLAVIFAVTIWRSASGRPSTGSILVLPMVNDGGDKGTDYLAGGISDSIINNLSQLPKLRVVASSTAFRYQRQQTDPQRAGRELGVDVVLTGTVRQQDGTLTVQTNLIKVADGSQIWGKRYHRKLSDVLAVQEEIAVAVSERLRLRLTREERVLVAKRPTENIAAYQAYVMGRFFWNKRTQEGLKKAIGYFQQAVDTDPNYALAHSGLADAYSVEVMYGYVSARSNRGKAKAAAKKALELDDTLAEAHTSLARASMFEWDWPAVQKEFKRAIESNPSYPMAHQWYGQALLVQGLFEEAIAEKKRGLDLDPASLTAQASLGWAFYYARQFDQSMAQIQKTLEMDPSFAMARTCLAKLYEQKKMFREAIAEWQKIDTSGGPPHIGDLARLYALSGDRPAALASLNDLLNRSKASVGSARSIAGVYLALGDKDHALEWLESDQDGSPITLKVDPIFADLHSEPRFAALLRGMKLAR
jgi:serine/threonine-protein kinase